MDSPVQRPAHLARTNVVPAVLASFLAIVGVDFLIHAVILSHWWLITATYWRAPSELFRLVPYAYAAFLVYSAALTWLLCSLKDTQPRTAIVTGAIGGAMIGFANTLGTYSILPLPLAALFLFPLSFAIELGAACACIAAVLATERPWRRLALVFALTVLLFVLGVVFQSLFFPALSSHRARSLQRGKSCVTVISIDSPSAVIVRAG